jgi:hypothetical protein
MSLSCTQLKAQQGTAQVAQDELILSVWDLTIEILNSIDEGPDHFLDVRPSVVANVARISITFSLDEIQENRRHLVVWIVEVN